MRSSLPVLFQLFGRGACRKMLGVIGLLGLLTVPMLAVEWNGSELELWGVRFESAGDPTREAALGNYHRELISWWWGIVGLAYLLPVVLMTAAASFSRDQVLWLRMTPCSARELALARLWRVSVSLLGLGSVGLPVAVGVSYWHDAPCRAAVWTVAGMLAHGLWAAGIVLLVGPMLRTPVDRALGAFFAFLTPVFAFLLFVAFEPQFCPTVRGWWPFAIPFIRLPLDPKPHILSAAGLGAVGMFLSVVIQPGHRRYSNAPTSRS